MEKNLLKNFAIFTAKHLCWSLFNKVTELQAFNFIKKKLQHGCFSVKYCEIFKNTYFEENLQTAACQLIGVLTKWLSETSYTE